MESPKSWVPAPKPPRRRPRHVTDGSVPGPLSRLRMNRGAPGGTNRAPQTGHDGRQLCETDYRLKAIVGESGSFGPPAARAATR